MFFERNLNGIDVVLKINEYLYPSVNDIGDVYCDCAYSFRMGRMATILNYRKDRSEAFDPKTIDKLADRLTDLLEGKITEPVYVGTLSGEFDFTLYSKHQTIITRSATEVTTKEILAVSVEWQIYLGTGSSKNYLTVTLDRDDITALRDYLNYVRTCGTI